MKVAVIHDSPIPPPTARELLVELVKEGCEATYLRISRISAQVSDGGTTIIYGRGKKLRIDGGIIRGLGLTITTETLFKRITTLKIIESAGSHLINSPDSILNARDKFRASQILSANGLPVPETLITEDIFLIPDMVREWGRVVIKPLMGSMGYGSVMVDNPDLAFMIAKAWQSYGQPIMIQKYRRKFERDIRVFVVGDEVIGAIYRYAPPTTWKTNVAQGGKVSRALINDEIVELALKATKALNLAYSGVDIGETNEGLVVYEANTMPNWQGFTEGMGFSPASRIARLIIDLIKK